MNVLDASDAIARAMKELGLNGSYDVRLKGWRSTGWVGKPGGDDVEVEVIIKPLPPLDTSAEEMFRRQNPGA